MSTPACSLVYLTCENYRDLWPTVDKSCAHLKSMYGFSKVLVVSDFGEGEFANAAFAAAGSASFSERVQAALRLVPDEYVLLMLDDYYVPAGRPFDFSRYASICSERRLDYLRLYPYPAKAKRKEENICLLHREQKYAMNLHPAIWNRESLLLASSKGLESPWDFERWFNSPEARAAIPDVYMSRKDFLPFVELLIGGKLSPEAKPYLSSKELDALDRPFLKGSSFRWMGFKKWLRRHLPLFIQKRL